MMVITTIVHLGNEVRTILVWRTSSRRRVVGVVIGWSTHDDFETMLVFYEQENEATTTKTKQIVITLKGIKAETNS